VKLVATEHILVRGAPVAPGEAFELDGQDALLVLGMRRAVRAEPAGGGGAKPAKRAKPASPEGAE
jgi:hypothetical protein